MHAALHLPSRAGVLHFLVQSFALLCLSYITAIPPCQPIWPALQYLAYGLQFFAQNVILHICKPLYLYILKDKACFFHAASFFLERDLH